jgi:hypothetical protein
MPRAPRVSRERSEVEGVAPVALPLEGATRAPLTERLAKLQIEYLIPGHGDMLKGKKAIEKNFQMILSEFFR